jgi:hypothetical protein
MLNRWLPSTDARSIGLFIYKEPSYNTVKAIDELNKAFVTIGKALPGYKN